MDKRDLARLALRLYHDKGIYESWIVRDVLSGKEVDTSQLVYKKFSSDIPTLKDLAKTADCLYIDLLTTEELKNDSGILFIPETEREERDRRLEAIMTPEQKEARAYADYLINCGLDTDKHFSFLPTEWKELIDLARLRSGIETVDNDAHFEDGQQDQSNGETFEGDYQNDTEPSAILSVENIPTLPGIEKPKAQQQQNSRPSKRETASKHPKRLTPQIKQRTRFISGQNRTLDNGIRLWEQDQTEVKISW